MEEYLRVQSSALGLFLFQGAHSTGGDIGFRSFVRRSPVRIRVVARLIINELRRSSETRKNYATQLLRNSPTQHPSKPASTYPLPSFPPWPPKRHGRTSGRG